jgi:protein TonB
MTAIRLPVSFALAVCATATLFWFLAMLIAVDPGGRTGHTVGPIQLMPVLVPDPEPVVIHEPPRPIEIPKRPPDVPEIQIDPLPELLPGDPTDLAPPWRGHGEGPLQHRGPDTTMNLSGSDRPPIPQVRMEPQYPDAAKDRGIEGWITFRFTVAADGSVKDLEIVDAEPKRIWDSATVRAVAGWKYQPAIHDGKPVEQRGVTVTYRFELER